jgi:putative RNA 2'-phosphotransferase
MWLRHKPERGGLTLSKEGWAAVPAVLAAFERQGVILSRPEFDEIVRTDPKSRYEVEADRIRARYGHSVELEEMPHPGMPPAALYQGTARRYLPRILDAGLRPMKRQFVHLSPDKATARAVGQRRDQLPVILRVAAHEAHEAGIQFYPRGKGIWLSDPIPARYLAVLEETQTAIPRPAADRPAAHGRTDRTRRAGTESAPGDPRRRRPRGGFMKPDR